VLQRRRTRWIALIVIAAAAVIASLTLRPSSSIVASAIPTTYSIFGNAVPAVISAADDTSVELGVRFNTANAGWIKAIRYYKGPQNTGQHVGTLWSSTGRQLAGMSFSETTDTGWQEAQLKNPVRVRRGATYTASYSAPNGHYAADGQTLSPSTPKMTNALAAVQGVYTYGGGVPKDSWRGMNYYVDVVFTTIPPSGSSPTTTATTTTTKPTTSASASSSVRPGPSNTGVPAGTVLSPYTGPRTISTAGTVIDSKDVTGSLVIRAKNVVIRNSKLHDDPGAVAGVYVDDSGSATITDSEIYNVQVGITYSNWTAVRVDIHDITFDAMKIGSNVLLRDSWVHNAKPSLDAHWDGAQVQAGVTNTVIQGNYIDSSGANTNSALFLCPDLGPSTNGPLTVTDNWLDGGNYSVFVLDGDSGRYYISDISVTNNRFGRASRYGPADVNVPVTWSGNVWDDTGKTVSK